MTQNKLLMSESDGPTILHERLVSLDILRGLAILMILFVNMPTFVAPYLFDPVPLIHGATDRSIRLIFDLLIENRFYPIFSFLFGAGFYIFMTRLKTRGLPAGWYYVRRMVILLLFGLLHMLVFWPGDILHTYALLGFVLLLFLGRAPKTVFIWASVLLVLNVLLYGLIAVPQTWLWNTAVRVLETSSTQTLGSDLQWVLQSAHSINAALQPNLERMNAAMHVYTDGDWGSWIMFHLRQEMPMVFQREIFALMGVFPFMLFGLYAAKRGIFYHPTDSRRGLMRLLMITTAISIPLELLILYLSLTPSPESLLRLQGFVVQLWAGLAGWAMSFLYLALYFLWGVGERWQKRLRFLAPVGRMALSNYLMQTILMTLMVRVFGLYGKTPLWLGLLMVLILLPINIVGSHMWLRTFRYGPFEYIWRAGTYGRLFPLREPCLKTKR
ncbi:MAG: DUF418 domain-containing protein [Candidatus Carbobacillus sp.]|nr:DUF418 domain-containing protein [Candidatus Carbobacillus sp.]